MINGKTTMRTRDIKVLDDTDQGGFFYESNAVKRNNRDRVCCICGRSLSKYNLSSSCFNPICSFKFLLKQDKNEKDQYVKSLRKERNRK